MDANGVERKRRKVGGYTSEQMQKVRREIATEVVTELAGDILADADRERVTAEDLVRLLIQKLGLKELR